MYTVQCVLYLTVQGRRFFLSEYTLYIYRVMGIGYTLYIRLEIVCACIIEGERVYTVQCMRVHCTYYDGIRVYYIQAVS